MPVPDFSPGEVLTASAMDSIGLWLVKTQTIGAGVSSVTVTGAFSADYDNYLITIAGGNASTQAELRLTLGAATANYYTTLVGGAYSGGSPFLVTVNNGAFFGWVGAGTTTSIRANINVNSPNLAEHTGFNATWNQTDTAGSSQGVLVDTTQYTAFNIFPQSGTLTGGVIRVYGFRN
jgi:hypothetical protein